MLSFFIFTILVHSTHSLVTTNPLYPDMTICYELVVAMQSPWFIDGQRKGESSVEERIADAVLPHFKADRHKFMTAGQSSLLFSS